MNAIAVREEYCRPVMTSPIQHLLHYVATQQQIQFDYAFVFLPNFCATAHSFFQQISAFNTYFFFTNCYYLIS